MSDSELSDVPLNKIPASAALEKAIRKETVRQFDTGGEPTVNTVRQGVEQALGLDFGFFKGHKTWKAKSKDIINDESQKQDNVQVPSLRTASAKPSPAEPEATKPALKTSPRKRPSPAIEKAPKKRQKKSMTKENSEDDLSFPSADESQEVSGAKFKKSSTAVSKSNGKPTAKLVKILQKTGKPRPPPKTQTPDSELSDAPPDDKGDDPTSQNLEDSESELSVLIDDEPRPKKKKQQSKEPSDKPKKATKTKAASDDDPDQAEIKRLQGWLLKCGIRKIWQFELRSYETSKAKIRHLNEMLSDIGMTGRYSLDKAAQIKEARELAADIEAVQEGNEIWGKDGEERSRRSKRSDYAEIDGDAEDAEADPKKQLVRAPKRYDFLSSDDEESD